MRFDDRLKTVMMQPVVDDHDRIVRWRQLVDLLARLPDMHDEALADAAFAMVEREAPAIPEAVRAASARNVAAYPLETRIVALFARDKLSVAAPVLAGANLSAVEWHEVGRDSSPDVASFILTLSRGGVTSSSPLGQAEPASTAPPVPPLVVEEDDATPSISQMVARIELLRTRREGRDSDFHEVARQMPVGPSQTRKTLPPVVEAGDHSPFRWESDSDGWINWVEGVPRGAFVGQSLAEVSEGLQSGRALAEREPFADAVMTMEHPTIAGEWRLSGIPAFSPVDGRFLGYRGIARKPALIRPPHDRTSHHSGRRPRTRDLEVLRETIHEIKTPLNAIIGFAEIIDGQYLGPAHRNYRQRAAEIVTQARMLLEAVQDLDLAARIQSGSQDGHGTSRVLDVFRALQGELEQSALRVGATLSIVPPSHDDRFKLPADMASRMLKRFLSSVINAAMPGERLVVTADWQPNKVDVAVSRPSASAHLSSSSLLDPSLGADGGKGDLLGLGFAFRLVRGLVRLVEGDLVIEDSRFVLSLPSA